MVLGKAMTFRKIKNSENEQLNQNWLRGFFYKKYILEKKLFG